MTEKGGKDPNDKGGDEQDKGALRKKVDDWMVRVSFAEAGQAAEGFKLTGMDLIRRTKLALDRIMVFKEELATEAPEGTQQVTGQGETSARPAKTPGDKIQVMVLDDEPIVGKRLKKALETHGFEVETYLKPKEALARIGEKEFDIVVTDLRMDEVDGIQVLDHVMAECPRTRVVLITGYATVEVAREALVKGAFDFIAKPFKPKDLRAVLNKAALSLGHKGVV
jgi:CheY-like chemotaxis protein